MPLPLRQDASDDGGLEPTKREEGGRAGTAGGRRCGPGPGHPHGLRGEAIPWTGWADGLAAEHALAAERFDLVLLDLGLPRLDGLDLLRRLRSQPDGQVPVLVLTSRDAKADRIQGLDAGADDYLSSPATWTNSRRACAP